MEILLKNRVHDFFCCPNLRIVLIMQKKFHPSSSFQEMFGKDAPAYEQLSEDEDWGPGKRKRREKESDAVDSLMTLHESENRHPNNEHNMTSKDSSSIKIKRHCFRIPRDAVEVLPETLGHFIYKGVVCALIYLPSIFL